MHGLEVSRRLASEHSAAAQEQLQRLSKQNDFLVTLLEQMSARSK